MRLFSTPPSAAIILGSSLLAGLGCQPKETPEPVGTDVAASAPAQTEAQTPTQTPTPAQTETRTKPDAEAKQGEVEGYSPYAGRELPTRVFWGDTHVHTSNSLDARAFGVTLGPEEAFRFARGEEVTATHGQKVKLARPLDWLVVADHHDLRLRVDLDRQRQQPASQRPLSRRRRPGRTDAAPRVPVPPVEAVIALSIAFVAHEIARPDAHGLTRRYPVAARSRHSG